MTEEQKLIEKLQEEVEKLKERQPSNSKTSSKPPSSDLIQKSETAKVDNSKESETEPASQTRRTAGTYRQNPKRIWASR